MLDVAFSKPVPPKAGAVALLLAEEEALIGVAAALNEASGGAIARAIEVASFKGQKGKTVLLFAPIEGLTRLLIVGLGKRAELTTLILEEAGGAIAAALSQEAQATVLAEGLTASDAAHLSLGAVLRAYRFDLYRTKEKPEDKPKLTGITVQAEDQAKARAAFGPLRAVAEGIYLARDLVTEPPNVLTPTEMAERCRALTKLGVKVEIMGPKELEKLGFGALLGVSQGSVQEPRMVVMQWNGAGGRKPRKPLVFVGKGVTFDTGGISIKPAGGMEDMKWDMAGAGAVVGLMAALAGRKAKADVVGLVGSAWALERVQEHGGMFSNDDELAQKLTSAGIATGEKLWRMPLGDAYDKAIKSDIADMKNIGGRHGSAIIAAQFIQRFVNNKPWAHLDIAGMAWSSKDAACVPKGATAYGVRLLARLVRDHYEA